MIIGSGILSMNYVSRSILMGHRTFAWFYSVFPIDDILVAGNQWVYCGEIRQVDWVVTVGTNKEQMAIVYLSKKQTLRRVQNIYAEFVRNT